MIKTNEVLIHSINIRGDYVCNKLRARKIWEALFRHTHAKDFKSFDNFLIDLKRFEEQLDLQQGNDIVEFYWVYWDSGNHTMTHVFTQEEPYKLIDNWDGCYGIQFEQDAQLIKILHVEVLDNAE